MIEKTLFKSYFTTNFWKPFKRLPVNICNFSTSEKKSLVEQLYEQIKDRTYYPSTPKCYLIKNKGNGVVRIVPVFEARDYIVYYYCVIRLEPLIAINRVENTFGGWSLAGIQHRSIEKIEVDTKLEAANQTIMELNDWLGVSVPSYSFNPFAWSKIYGEFNARLFEEIQLNKRRFYAEFDISNFYDSIRLDILERKIRKEFDKDFEDDLNLLFHFLQYWNRNVNHYNQQSVGIPQEAMNDCSRILANFYLQEHDLALFRECKHKNATYLRYCDDQFIFADSKEDLEYLLYKASKRLKALGLSLNQKKVYIGTVEDLLRNRSFETFDKLSEENSRQNPEKVESFVDDIISILDSNSLQEIKRRGTPLLNRALFCCIDKIPMQKRMRLMAEYTKEHYLLEADSDKFKRIYQLLQMNEEKKELIRSLDAICLKTFHNFFHYEVLKFYISEGFTHQHIQSRIDTISEE